VVAAVPLADDDLVAVPELVEIESLTDEIALDLNGLKDEIAPDLNGLTDEIALDLNGLKNEIDPDRNGQKKRRETTRQNDHLRGLVNALVRTLVAEKVLIRKGRNLDLNRDIHPSNY
jgi:hypothetical protein